jgi:hypothetical protein
VTTKTKSEHLFETFLAANGLPFERIEEDVSPRPDYCVSIGDSKIVFELKELAEDESFEVVKDPSLPYLKFSSRTLGDHLRRRIAASRKQIQYGAKQLGLPSALLVYNCLDPLQMFGTEDMDFIAAMYGEYTVMLNRENRSSDWFNGNKQLLQREKNTSFSATGRLCDRGGGITVTLFENVFAKVKISYDNLPPCFDVRRIQISTGPSVATSAKS